ncbi:MAG: DUF559 domain-containing protein [Candidatus Peregrinibacteria bacterium]|nr:DUF559 domain-containing protein [Candidatus Peregrinibacteria bacterium]
MRRATQQRGDKLRFARKLRRRLTPHEEKLWAALRGRSFFHIKFRRQFPIGRYIADFVSLQHRLVIEIDGSIHDDRQDVDLLREEYLRDHGYRILRFTNNDIEMDFLGVLKTIHQTTKNTFPSPPSKVQE